MCVAKVGKANKTAKMNVKKRVFVSIISIVREINKLDVLAKTLTFKLRKWFYWALTQNHLSN